MNAPTEPERPGVTDLHDSGKDTLRFMKQRKKKKRISAAVILLIALDCILCVLAVMIIKFDGAPAGQNVQAEAGADAAAGMAEGLLQTETETIPEIAGNPDDWKIDAGTLCFYSDAGVTAWCADPEAKEKSQSCDAVTFSDAVTAIPNGMLEECANLKTVTMGKNLKTIGADAFALCENLTDVQWSEALESIGDGAFCGTGFTGLVLPENLCSIGEMAFDRCPNLETIVMPDSLVSLQGCNFTGCEKLKTVEWSRGLSLIGDISFERCTALREVRLPASVKTLGYKAFAESGIVRLVFEGEIEEIAALYTNDMPDLKEIVFLGLPPRGSQTDMANGEGESSFGLLNNGDYGNKTDWTPDVRVYCMSDYAQYFEQKNGMWNGFNISVISSPDELPPIDA